MIHDEKFVQIECQIWYSFDLFSGTVQEWSEFSGTIKEWSELSPEVALAVAHTFLLLCVKSQPAPGNFVLLFCLGGGVVGVGRSPFLDP